MLNLMPRNNLFHFKNSHGIGISNKYKSNIEIKTLLILTEFNSDLAWIIYSTRLELCDTILVIYCSDMKISLYLLTHIKIVP